MSTRHVSVMREEVLDLLARRPGGLPEPKLVDCTLGGGGHAEALLLACEDAELLGLDRDAEAVARSARVLARFGGRVDLQQGDYRELARFIEKKTGRAASAPWSPTSASAAISSRTRPGASPSSVTARWTCASTAPAAGPRPAISCASFPSGISRTCSAATARSRMRAALLAPSSPDARRRP